MRCPQCGREFRRVDHFVQHLRDEHGMPDFETFDPAVPDAAPPPEDEGDGAEQAPPENPAAPPAVNHALSGPPEGPYWDWNKSGDGYKARTALPDVTRMGLPKCVVEEYQAQMNFIDTACKPILENIHPSTALKPRELAKYEEEKKAFDECTCRLMICYTLTSDVGAFCSMCMRQRMHFIASAWQMVNCSASETGSRRCSALAGRRNRQASTGLATRRSLASCMTCCLEARSPQGCVRVLGRTW